MTGKKILESLQYAEDELVEEAAEYRSSQRKPLRTWGGLAACLFLLLGAWLLLNLRLALKSAPANHEDPGAGEEYRVTPEPKTTQRPADIPGAPVPGGVPDSSANQGLDPVPEVFAWTSDPSVSPPGEDAAQAYVVLVGRELTAEEVKACVPGIRLEWMEDFSGSAAYRLADGSGGLAFAQLEVSHAELGNRYRISLREATEQNMAASGLTGTLPSMDGQGYRARREYYAGADGERVMILVSFVREGILYTLDADVPEAEETPAALDLRDLLLAYAGTHSAPDLGSFRYSGGQD